MINVTYFKSDTNRCHIYPGAMSSIRFTFLPMAATLVLSLSLASPAFAEGSKAGPGLPPAPAPVTKVVSPGMVGPEVVDDWDVANASVDA